MKNRTFLLLTALVLCITSCSKDEENIIQENTNPAFMNGLSFVKIKDLGDNLIEEQMVGFVGDSITNNLYVSCRDKFIEHTEKIYKFNVNTLELITKNNTLSDFVTKRNHIYNNKLYVFGGSGFTSHDLDLNQSQSQVIYSNSRIFSRFGSAISYDDVYIIGGFLGGEDSTLPGYDKKIWKHNITTNSMTLQAQMPKNRNGGSSEIINQKIYTFFGYENINDPSTTTPNIQLLNDIQIYNITNNSFQTISLPAQVKVSFTAKYNNHIFVAGNKSAGNFNSSIDGSFFGYFNTETNTMTEIPVTVSDNTFSYAYISEIEIMNGKIYAIVKDSQNNFSIQVANLQ